MASNSRLSFDRVGDTTLRVRLVGSWRLQPGLSSAALVQAELKSLASVQEIAFDATALTSWDTSILIFLAELSELCRERGIRVKDAGLPAGVRRLLALAGASPERTGALGSKKTAELSLLERIGTTGIAASRSGAEVLAFLGEVTMGLGRLLGGRARFRTSDLSLLIQDCGTRALPIVTLISFLVGVIFAFVGAVQLKQFGAQLYIADLVGIAMMRDMGAMMTAVIMAGRTGAAFAAQIGTMKVTQELDALTTMGLSPMEFLVLPRVIALVLMMPLLCLYSDFVGILGGAAVGFGMLDLSWATYFQETAQAVRLADVFGGVFKSSVYGVLIALSGCLRGLHCGASSSAVGDAATSAVVTGIVTVIVACGIFSVIFYVLGI